MLLDPVRSGIIVFEMLLYSSNTCVNRSKMCRSCNVASLGLGRLYPFSDFLFEFDALIQKVNTDPFVYENVVCFEQI